MQPSYIICNNCGHKVSKLFHDEEELYGTLRELRQNGYCSRCGSRKFIRKVASKL